jgi:hypothetical protein
MWYAGLGFGSGLSGHWKGGSASRRSYDVDGYMACLKVVQLLISRDERE